MSALERLQGFASQNTPALTSKWNESPSTFTGAKGGSIAGDLFSINEKVANSPSFQYSSNILLGILQGGEIPETFRESVFSSNQVAIGKSIIDRAEENKQLAGSLNEQIAIRESQRAETNAYIDEVNQRLSGQISSLGNSIGDLSKSQSQQESKSWFDGFPKVPTFDQLKMPLLLAGLALGAIIILPKVLKR